MSDIPKPKHLYFKKDTRDKKRWTLQDKIKELTTRRDQLLDHGMVKRAASLENQIRSLKREAGMKV